MIYQPVFVRILIPERDYRLLSKISLHGVRIVIIRVKNVGQYVSEDSICYINDDLEIMLAHLWEWWIDRRRFLTVNYDTCLTHIEPICDIGGRRAWKRWRHWEDGEWHEDLKKCEGIGGSEVHVCVQVIKTEIYWKSACSTFKFGSFIILSTELGLTHGI